MGTQCKCVLLFLILAVALCSASWAQQAARAKKLIEYGWDVPKPAFVRENIREMEKRPFDGLILRMAVGGRVFVKQKWSEEQLREDFEHLQNIEWQQFTDNFIIMYAASEVDWFNDQDWKAVCHNVRMTARAAKLGRCKGLCFDAEPYGTNPWHYPSQAHAAEKTFAEYQAKVRERGAQFMQAITAEMPEAVLHTFFLLGYFRDWWFIEDRAARDQKLSSKHYALYPAFINGLLDAAGPGVIITDGNESAYYYQDALSFYRAYHGIRQSALALIAPENVAKYQTQVQVSQALYVDHLFNLRTKKYLSAYLSPEERARWFEHNVYYALTTSDEYVWLYSERMNWWTNQNLPPGLEEAVRSARSKVRNHRPLGFDIEPSLEAARAKEQEALRSALTRRTTEIPRLPADSRPPRIDGNLNDATWSKLPTLQSFLPVLRARETTVEGTEVRVGYDDRNLYIGIRCAEPNVSELRIAGRERDDDIWLGDSVDVFLQPPDQTPRYFHFIINPRGVRWDAIWDGENNDLSYNPAWERRTQVSEKEWTVEMAIPWSALNQAPPKPGSKWRANICRQRAVKRELSSWSQVVGGFLEAENFGTWVFR